MTVPNVACTNCGKPFTTDDLRGTSCRYCGTLLAHHARAQQQVAVVQQMMADRNGNGIPDAYEGLVANAQANAMQSAFGQTPYTPYNPYAPQAPGIIGAPAMYAVNTQFVQMERQVARTMSTVVVVVIACIGAAVVLTIGAGVLVAVLAR